MSQSRAEGTSRATGDSSTSELSWMLSSFAAGTPGVSETVAVSSDGFVLAASAGVSAPGVEQLAAIISGLTSLTRGAADLYDLDEVRQIIVEMTRGFLFVMSTRTDAAVGALTASDCDVGALGYEMTLLTERVGDALTPELIGTLKNALSPDRYQSPIDE